MIADLFRTAQRYLARSGRPADRLSDVAPHRQRRKAVRHRRVLFERLENRQLLSADITSVTSSWGDFRFLFGGHLPEVRNTYTANVVGAPSRVDFRLGGQTVSDRDPSNGWSAEFNMSALSSATSLVVDAYNGNTVVDEFTQNVRLTQLPAWLQQSNVVYSAMCDPASGYTFSVYDKDFDHQVTTPADWQWNPLPKFFRSPLLDLSNRRTGFDTGWSFTLVSTPAGAVSAKDTGYRVHAQVLGVDIWDYRLTTGQSGDFEAGPASGSYQVTFNPAFNSDLTFSGLAGTASLELDLDLSRRLAEFSLPIWGVPFASLAAFNVGVDADFHVGFEASATVTLKNGGPQLAAATIHPDVSVGLTVFAEGSIGKLGPWSLAKAGVSVTGTLTQDFICTYANDAWSYDCPGSLQLSGNLYWDAVFHCWQGALYLFSWDVASWDPCEGLPVEPVFGSLPQPLPVGPPVETAPVEGTDLSLDAAAWDDHSGWAGNQVDGVMEAGEHPYLRIKLGSKRAIANVTATLQSTDPDIQILRRDAAFDDFGAPGSHWAQNPCLVALNFTNHRTSDFVLHVTYKIGAQWYFQDFSPFAATFLTIPEVSAAFSVTSVPLDDSQTIPGGVGNDGDGVLQSGETAHLRPVIQNNGNARATHVSVCLTTDSPGVILPPNNCKQYPDLPPGQSSPPTALARVADYFLVRAVIGFSGNVSFDVHITYQESQQETILKNAFVLQVGAVAWLEVTASNGSHEYSFGLAPTTTDLILPLTIWNRGTAEMHVTGITTSHADTTVVTTPRLTTSSPWPIPAQSSRTFDVRISTRDLSGQNIQRVVTVEADGRQGTGDNTVTLSGLISDFWPYYHQVPNTPPMEPDIYGNIIVWADSRYGQSAIFAYDLAQGREYEICRTPGNHTTPRIGKNLIAWADSDASASSPYSDIYAYSFPSGDLSQGTLLTVSTAPGWKRLVGVDSGKIAFSRIYQPYLKPWSGAADLWLYDVASQTTTAVAGFDGTQTVPYGNWDFSDGVLTWAQGTYRGAASYTLDKVMKYQVAGSSVDSAPVKIASATGLRQGPMTGGGKVVWSSTDPSTGMARVWVWRPGLPPWPITPAESSVDYGTNHVAIGGDWVVYDRTGAGSDVLLTQNLTSGKTVTIYLLGSFNAQLRMEGQGVAWIDMLSDGEIAYEYLGQPDLAIAPADITFSNPNPGEGERLNVTATVHNLTDIAAKDDIHVRLYEGDPRSGGIQLGTERVLYGGLSSHGQAEVTFGELAIATEGVHTLYVQVAHLPDENPANNLAAWGLTVQDNDTLGPAITQVSVTEDGGDGDGLIGTDEQVKISWVLTDPSGVNSAQLRLDGVPTTPLCTPSVGTSPTLSCSVVAAAPPAGGHTWVIRAADSDNSPAVAEYSGQFDVVAAEKLAIQFAGQWLADDPATQVDLGRLRAADPQASALFTVKNQGGQTLRLTGLTVEVVQGAADYVAPPGRLAPGAAASFAILPDTQAAGPFSFQVSLRDGTAGSSPRSFMVTGTVDTPPQIGALTAAPNPAWTTDAVTLTASSVTDLDGQVQGVAFYRESNLQAGLQVAADGDTFVGAGSSGPDGWIYTFPASDLTPGTYRYYAQATDTEGSTSPADTLAPAADVEISNRHPWQNSKQPLDVDGDGQVIPLDVLQVINRLNSQGPGALPSAATPSAGPPPFVDVNGDDTLTPLDALLVINYLNSETSGSGEGEAAVPDTRPASVADRLWEAGEMRRDSAERAAAVAAFPGFEQIAPADPKRADGPKPAFVPLGDSVVELDRVFEQLGDVAADPLDLGSITKASLEWRPSQQSRIPPRNLSQV